MASGALKILWVATKPPWPPRDGGRLVASHTITALAAAGHAVTVVTPALDEGEAALLPDRVAVEAVPARLAPLALAALRALLSRVPISIARHTHPAVRGAVDRLLAAQAFDVVHAEQAQALPQCDPAAIRSLPVVFRAQNVESDLWTQAARGRGESWFGRREGERFARFEGDAVSRAAATVALTEDDAARLEGMAGGKKHVVALPAPFPAELPPGEGRLAGDPALVIMGSPRWLPNRRGAEDFLRESWPRARRVLPKARLHLFGFESVPGRVPAVELHPSLVDSREALPSGAVLLVPLDVASGVRMKVLEAWARGVPVVATPAAAKGLAATGGRELLIAEGAEGFEAALRRLRDEPRLSPSLVEAGRALLRRRHDPATVAGALARVYVEAGGMKKKS